MDKWSNTHGSPLVFDVGEEKLLKIVLSHSNPSDKMTIRNGDDAAVIAPSSSALTTSVDAQVEGVHFRRAWLSPRELGLRAFRVSASDIVAMGQKPDWALLSLGLPSDLSVYAFEELIAGFSEGCAQAGAQLIGGNLTRSKELSLHVTVFSNSGESNRFWSRSAAAAGDKIWITGSPGNAAAGLAILESEQSSSTQFANLLESWRTPLPHWKILKQLHAEDLIHSCMDLSDGLVLDGMRMAHASALRFIIELTSIPRDKALTSAANTLGYSIDEWLLSGGESYQLLLTASQRPPQWAYDIGIRCIGHVESGSPGIEVTKKGESLDLSLIKPGWDPF